MTFLYPWGYSLLALLFVVFVSWRWRCRPRALSIDTQSGVLSFLPACRCRITLRQPVALRKFSSVYWRGGGKYYSVELVNPRGEDKVLHVFAPEAAAEQLCRFISQQFGLRNRGYMG